MVFKFGGASLKDANGVKNVAKIITQHAKQSLVIIVSAMGKTTNALERIVALGKEGKSFEQELQSILHYHGCIIDDLFREHHPVKEKVFTILKSIAEKFNTEDEYDITYDQIVSQGEIVSSLIVAAYLNQFTPTTWVDARSCILTDSSFREGRVQWATSSERIRNMVNQNGSNLVVTQGFIGSNEAGLTTTLGREGSDYTGAIFASALHAKSLTIWKDVPGVMNADPKRIPTAVVFDELPFKEAAEMTYYGASVIHPKTIKPLANNNIPLIVKSFIDPNLPGTVIHDCKVEKLPPLIVFKDNQCLISCKVTDYTFISEKQLQFIFSSLSELDLRVNVMQNSAISFSFCLDFRESKVTKLIQLLQKHFEVYYNTNLTLITIKNYDQESVDEYHRLPGILLEQSSRSTLQLLIKG
jgi:aspartate kinase